MDTHIYKYVYSHTQPYVHTFRAVLNSQSVTISKYTFTCIHMSIRMYIYIYQPYKYVPFQLVPNSQPIAIISIFIFTNIRISIRMHIYTYISPICTFPDCPELVAYSHHEYIHIHIYTHISKSAYIHISAISVLKQGIDYYV